MGKALKAEDLSSYSQRPHKSHAVMGAPAIQGMPKSSRSGPEHYSDGMPEAQAPIISLLRRNGPVLFSYVFEKITKMD